MLSPARICEGRKCAFELHWIGLSHKIGEANLHIFGDGEGTNSLYKKEGLVSSQGKEEKIRLDTLNHYCLDRGISHIDIPKLDVEGHELSVLKGGRRLLDEGRIRFVQFEYGGIYIDARVLLKDMFDILQKFGYQMHKIFYKELRPVVRYDQRLENFQYSNWVATG